MPADESYSQTENDIGVVILGAGHSRRFGADKRLAPLGNKTVAECTLDLYCSVFDCLRVVIKPEDQSLAALLQVYPVEIIYCPDAHKGMAHSLACGCANLTWKIAFVALLDMPFVDTATLVQLKQLAVDAGPAAIVQPQLENGQIGHPVGWSRRYFQDLAKLEGDEGARHLLRRFQQQIILLPTDDRGIVQDIDRPADLLQKN